MKNYLIPFVVLMLIFATLGYLWMENHRLHAEVEQIHVAVPPAQPTKTLTAASQGKSAILKEPGKVGEAPQAEAEAAFTPALGGFFSSDAMVKMAADAARQESERTVNRLNLRLKLTGEQKSKLEAFLDEDHRASLKLLEKAAADGLLNRMMKDPVNISAADQALVEEMQMVAHKPEAMDVFLESILTLDQLAEYSKSKEEQRVSRAEDTAQASVSYFGQQFDLTPLQKDQLFGAVSRREMARPAPAASAASEEETGDSDEAILQSVLTPEQFDVWQQSRQPKEDAVQRVAR